MKKALAYIKANTKNTANLYKMGQPVREELVADATKPVIMEESLCKSGFENLQTNLQGLMCGDRVTR